MKISKTLQRLTLTLLLNNSIRKSRFIFLVFFFFFIFSLPVSFSQVKISGVVKTIENETVPYANILLLKATDSSLIKGTIANEQGYWTHDIAPGKIVVKITMIGYEPAYSDILYIEDNGEPYFLENPVLKEHITELDEIVIKEQKLFLEKKSDRVVVNISNRPSATGSTVLEVLEKSPGVTVNPQTNSLSMNGRSGVLIMIDGKISNLPLDAIVQQLDGMNSSNIEKIELISAPPANYDASGNAGIINIVLKETTDSGTNGNIGVVTGYNRGEILGGNLNISHRKSRFEYFLDYTVNRNDNLENWNFDRYLDLEDFTQTIHNYSIRDYTLTVQNLRTGFEYDFSDKTAVSLLLTGYSRVWNMDAYITEKYTLSMDSVIHTEMNVTESNKWKSLTASIGGKHQIDERQEINVMLDYLFYRNDDPSGYNISTTAQQSTEPKEDYILFKKTTPINFEIASIDYSNKINTNMRLEVGLKSSFSQFDNTVDVKRLIDGELSELDKFSSKAVLDEKIMSAYSSLNWNVHSNWIIIGGLRYEYTDTYLSTPGEKGLVDRSYSNFFPSLNINYNIKDESAIQFSYNRRINRPSYNDMAPFTYLVGPNTFLDGNPALKPSLVQAADLGYTYKQWWISLQYAYSKDEIAPFQPEIKHETNEHTQRSQNLEFMRTMGIQTSMPINVTNWWEWHTHISYYHYTYRTGQYQHNPMRNLGSIAMNMTHSIQLPKEFVLELSGSYQSNTLWGIIEVQPQGAVNLGIKKSLRRNFGTITLAVNDLFKTSNYQFNIEVPEEKFRSYLTIDRGVRTIRLTYSLAFGNKKLNSVTIKSGSEEERKRVQ